MHQHYGCSCVIFDGYKQGPSIKDHKHKRRLKKTCTDIQLGEFMQAHHNQQISCQMRLIKADGNIVHIADGDADTVIVTCTLQYAGKESDVSVHSYR